MNAGINRKYQQNGKEPISIFKKRDWKNCQNYQGISLLDSAYKIGICQNYKQMNAETPISEKQSDFRKSQS